MFSSLFDSSGCSEASVKSRSSKCQHFLTPKKAIIRTTRVAADKDNYVLFYCDAPPLPQLPLFYSAFVILMGGGGVTTPNVRNVFGGFAAPCNQYTLMPGFNQACDISAKAAALISFLNSRWRRRNLCCQLQFATRDLGDV